MPIKMGDGFEVKRLTDFGAFHHEFMFGLGHDLEAGFGPMGHTLLNAPWVDNGLQSTDKA